MPLFPLCLDCLTRLTQQFGPSSSPGALYLPIPTSLKQTGGQKAPLGGELHLLNRQRASRTHCGSSGKLTIWGSPQHLVDPRELEHREHKILSSAQAGFLGKQECPKP